MKRKILTGILVIVAMITIYMVYHTITTLNRKSEGSKNTMVLSALVSKLTAGEKTMNTYLKPSLLIYFNSECDFCQRQLELINDTPEILEQFQLILVSYQDTMEVENYLANYEKIKEGKYALYHVAPDKVLATFGKTSVPQLFVYQNNLLKSSFKGFTKTALILKTIHL